MDLNVKCRNTRLYQKDIWENLKDLQISIEILDLVDTITQKMINWTSSKLKPFLSKDPFIGWKEKLQSRKKIAVKNFENSTVKKQYN